MAKVSGHGGYWVIQGSPNQIIHNAEYEYDVEISIDDVTDSSSGGAAQGLPIIYKMQSLTMQVAEDDVAFPMALGLVEGARVTLWLKRGALNQFDRVDNTVVKTVRVTNNQQLARRCHITCEYGTLTRNVAPPT